MKRFVKTTAIFLTVILMFTMVLTACGTKDAYDPNKTIENFHMTVQNDAAPIKGGTLMYGIVSDSPLAGIFSNMFNEDAPTAEVGNFFWESLLDMNAERVYTNEGAATFTYDIDKCTFTITIKPEYKDKLKWHDGEPVTCDDLLFAYEVICHPDYDGIRYDEMFQRIVGAEEYHAGTAATISGISVSDDKQSITFTYKPGEFPPSILSGGIWTIPEPRHYYAGIAVKDMRASDKSRSKAIGFGPFKITNVVEGESVQLVRFDDYFRGPAKLDGVNVQIVSTDLVPAAMEEGKFDVVEFPTAKYGDYKTPTNYQYLGYTSLAYGYIGFKLGKWSGDAENGSCVVDPNAKMADVNLRKAMAYAYDAETMGETLYSGLRYRATTIMDPYHTRYQDLTLKGYYYDPAKANQILDDAGYKDTNGDGFREKPDGSPLVINFASMGGNETAETIAQMTVQDWKAVGLNIQLSTGGTIEFNLFYDLVEADDPGIDVYAGAWSVGDDPSPSGLWGTKSPLNYTRYSSPTLQTTMDNINSNKAWDAAYRTEQYNLFQKQFEDEIPAFPTLWRVGLKAVNNRVKNYSVDPEAKDIWIKTELTADTPYVK